MCEENIENVVVQGTGRSFIVRSGAGFNEENTKPKSSEDIREMVQEVLNRSLNISTLLGSGASAGAVPLMSEMIKTFEAELNPELKTEYENIKENLQKLNPDGASANNLENLLTWLSKRVENEITPSTNAELLHFLLYQFERAVCEVDYSGELNPPAEENTTKIGEVKASYGRFLQGLGKSREILSRHERTVFDVINLFTTNYDLFHEYALVESKYLYADGFSSGIKNEFATNNFHMRPVDLEDRFRDRIEPINPFFRLFKLHGSVDWQFESSKSRTDITTRIRYVAKPHKKKNKPSAVLIKPMSSKYVITQGTPFSDLFREFVNVLGTPDSVLFVSGYGFGDEHINNLIADALRRKDFLLYAFVSYPKENSPIYKFIESCKTSNAKFIYPQKDLTPDYVKFSEVASFVE